MNEDEKFFLSVEHVALETAVESGLLELILTNPSKGFLVLFDSAYAMGFGACQKMMREGTDVQQFNLEILSLIPQKDEPKRD